MRGGLPGALAMAVLLSACPYRPPAPPSQPVPFSHLLHAETNRIGCEMCHAWAEHSPVAGIPSMARCSGCHKFIGRDKPAVQAVLKAAKDGTPLAWSRVWRLPDHVFFTHSRHLAARLACQECHGEVETMQVVTLVREPTMGWCIDCHRARSAPTDCLMCHK